MNANRVGKERMVAVRFVVLSRRVLPSLCPIQRSGTALWPAVSLWRPPGGSASTGRGSVEWQAGPQLSGPVCVPGRASYVPRQDMARIATTQRRGGVLECSE